MIQLKKKLCKCGCGKEGYIWAKGMLKQCYFAKVKPPSKIPKISEKQKIKPISNDNLEKWFKDTATFMNGVCYNCGGKSSKGNIKYQKYSQAHIFAKNDKAFPSIKTNLLNFVELCYFGNSCHSNFDNNGYEYAKNKMPKLWNLIIDRAKILIPLMSKEEQARVPIAIIEESEKTTQ